MYIINYLVIHFVLMTLKAIYLDGKLTRKFLRFLITDIYFFAKKSL